MNVYLVSIKRKSWCQDYAMVVVAEIKKDCMKQLIGNDNVSAYQYSQKIKDMVNDNIKSFLEENKETIIKEAVNQLAEKLSRTKAAKEALSKTLGDIF